MYFSLCELHGCGKRSVVRKNTLVPYVWDESKNFVVPPNFSLYRPLSLAFGGGARSAQQMSFTAAAIKRSHPSSSLWNRSCCYCFCVNAGIQLSLSRRNVISSAGTDSKRFCHRRKFGKHGNTLCISCFSNCTDVAKDPLLSVSLTEAFHASQGRRAAGLKSAFLPRRDSSPRGHCAYRTGAVFP